MSRNVEILNNVEYATALKEAIILRQKKTIPPEIDNMLGVFANSITHWVVVDAVKNGKLWREQSNDEDFCCNVRLAILKQLDKKEKGESSRKIEVNLEHKFSENSPDKFEKELYGNRQGLGFEATTTM